MSMMINNTLKLVADDPYLSAFKEKIERRLLLLKEKKKDLSIVNRSLSDFACGHLYFGLHRDTKCWVFREYAPNATHIEFIIGERLDGNIWKPAKKIPMQRVSNENWEVRIGFGDLHNLDLYRLAIYWDTGRGERLPAWCNRVVQDPTSMEFSAQVWLSSFLWEFPSPIQPKTPLIYEAHIGMATEEFRVGTFDEFRLERLQYIKDIGYNTIQLMGIQEHPYYGSFGYHVSNFYAVSSRFGTPDELKKLIDAAHGLGLRIIMDLVHSHSVKNELEGLNIFDGNPGLYFYNDERRNHPEWGSLCFDYGKGNVLHYLLSNCKYWIEEYHIDGFRFDGVSSMLYNNHGIGISFKGYDMYFDDSNVNWDAITYLQLANGLIHELKNDATTIAEEMSGMPGVASPVDDGGIGFDYRLSMGVPDYWIKEIETSCIGNWDTGRMFYELTQKRKDEKTISYVESHDQALVGDQTVIFRLLHERIYDTMLATDNTHFTQRAIILHKMIRLVTIATAGNGYLNFMGNEFGHPEWIDFPRIGNNWSYQYARRQWSLNNAQLKYYELGMFDRTMLSTIIKNDLFDDSPNLLYQNIEYSILIFKRNDLLFIFNFGNNDYISKEKWDLKGAIIILSESLRSGSKRMGILKNRRYLMKIPAISYFIIKKDI